MDRLTIGEAARELNVSVDWLRDCEAKGKLPKARRNLSGWRVYSHEDLATIRELLIPSRVEGVAEGKGGGW